MPRALAGAVGAMLAIAVGASAPKAPAQVPAPQSQGQPMPGQKGCFPRLEEMRVELALLSDPSTFPYAVAASARIGALDLYGFVPNNGIRQHVLDVARRTTILMVHDDMGLKPTPRPQPSPCPPSVLQKEGMELLQNEMGETAKQVSLEARLNGVIVVKGRIDTFENKVKISRLFRQLAGCGSVVNQLIVEPIVRDGKEVVRVTQDGSLFLPPSALGQKEPAAAPPPTLVLTNNPSSQKSQWNLPKTVPPKPPSTPITPMPAPPTSLRAPIMPTPANIGNAPEPYAPSRLPVKWGRPESGWESQANELEALHAARQQALKPAPGEAPKRLPEPKKATPLPAVAIKSSGAILSPQPNIVQTQPAPDIAWQRPVGSEPKNRPPTRGADASAKSMLHDAHPQDLMPTPVKTSKRPPESKTAMPLPTVVINSSGAIASPRPNFAEARPAPAQDTTWRRPGGYEEAEPKSPPPTSDIDASSKPQPILRSARRWPPAYVTGTPPSQGNPAVIVFDDDPPPAQPVSATALSGSIVPADLQRRVQMLCGRDAHEVSVSTQRDGNVLVRVRVANRSIEDQLSRKILSLPEMTSPRVRLLMEVRP